ncbi:MAG: hypothetical protein K1X75_08290 [Leptospirales bacterium]|nr:hypothetical protein [Leptospirales bacterium]
MNALQSLLGLAAFCAIAWLFSENRRKFEWRVVLPGLALQLLLALILLKVEAFRNGLRSLNHVVEALSTATAAGTSFVFGYLGGAPLPFAEPPPGSTFILAFQALPIVMVISALASLLFYWKILPIVVRGFSWALQKTLRVGGAVGVSAAANIFVGMVEAPLFIRPYLNKMTRSELFIVMTAGMATIAGTVMVLYASILTPVLGASALGHLLVASIISAPAGIVIARIMVPESGEITHGHLIEEHPATGAMDAITHGALDGLKLWLNIIAMLVVLVALVHLINQMLGALSGVINGLFGTELAAWTLQGGLGAIMQPLVWLMGVPWQEARIGGELMGVKVVLNEFLAYIQLGQTPTEALSERSRVILAYALCGFANFASLGIMIGGMGAMAPERRSEIVGMGLRSIVSGVLSTMMTGAVAGLILAF